MQRINKEQAKIGDLIEYKPYILKDFEGLYKTDPYRYATIRKIGIDYVIVKTENGDAAINNDRIVRYFRLENNIELIEEIK